MWWLGMRATEFKPFPICSHLSSDLTTLSDRVLQFSSKRELKWKKNWFGLKVEEHQRNTVKGTRGPSQVPLSTCCWTPTSMAVEGTWLKGPMHWILNWLGWDGYSRASGWVNKQTIIDKTAKWKDNKSHISALSLLNLSADVSLKRLLILLQQDFSFKILSVFL